MTYCAVKRCRALILWMSELTFTPRQVCIALNVPHGTLNSWAHAGLFKGLDAEKTVPGKARKFTLRDLRYLAVMAELLYIGMSAERARYYAAYCVRNWPESLRIEAHPSAFVDTEMLLVGNEEPDDPEATPTLELKINPKPISDLMDERLAHAAEQGEHAVSARIGRAPIRAPGRRAGGRRRSESSDK